MSTTQPKILITGVSGHFGRLALTHLIETYGYPPSQIIAASRNVQGLASWVERGVEVRTADFSDPQSLNESFRGVQRLLLVSTDSLDNAVRLQHHTNAVNAAKEAGVDHIFYTSMPEPETSLVAFASVHAGTEAAIKASGLTWTILRNNWYFENLLLTLPGALASGSLFTAAGDGSISYISRRDLARAAAATLITTTGIDNSTFTLTGKEALSIDEVAARVSKVFEKSIHVVHVPLEAIIEGAKSHGIPEFVAIVLASFDSAARAGDLAGITSDFAKLTGNDPQPFDEWLLQNKDPFETPG
jgi:NAD(P)H dehydrogenase (quinone)